MDLPQDGRPPAAQAWNDLDAPEGAVAPQRGRQEALGLATQLGGRDGPRGE